MIRHQVFSSYVTLRKGPDGRDYVVVCRLQKVEVLEGEPRWCPIGPLNEWEPGEPMPSGWAPFGSDEAIEMAKAFEGSPRPWDKVEEEDEKEASNRAGRPSGLLSYLDRPMDG